MLYYILCFSFSFIVSILYFSLRNTQRNFLISSFFIFFPITTLGYWLLASSLSVEQALAANKVLYFGICYSALALLITILFLCRIRVGRAIRALLFLFSSIVFAGNLTCGYNTWFYRSAAVHFENGVCILTKEYGPLHTLYYVMFILYALLGIFALLYALKCKRDVSVKNIVLLLAAEIITIVAAFAGRFIGSVDLICICYVIAQIVFLFISGRLALYDIDGTVISALTSQGSVGVASFDHRGRFLGCNSIARECYPPIDRLRVDFGINAGDASLSQLSQWISETDTLHSYDYQLNGRYYRVMQQHLYDNGHIRGCHLVFLDRTEEYLREKHLEHLAVTDGLTGLLNRRAFEDQLVRITQGGIRTDFCLLSLDVNGLKEVNDTMGHAAGDELLISAGAYMSDAFSPLGTVYRVGGDEFAALLYCSSDELENALQRFEASCAAWQGEFGQTLSLSIGAASHREFPDYSMHELEKKADQRMYASKDAYYIRTGIDRRRH